MPNKINKQEFIKRASKLYNNKYSYSNIKYKDYNTSIKLFCPLSNHGYFNVKPTKHINRKQECSICTLKKISKKFRTNTKDFIKKAKLIHGDKYDYNKVKYINSHTKIIITCKKHNDFNIKPSDHIWGMNGCYKCQTSKGELKIEQYLNEHNFKYINQYKFKECKNKLPLPFDFYLPKQNICIEYDGEQHFKSIKCFGGNLKFKQTLLNDKIKTQYCKNNNIKLIRIPYTEFKNINSILKKIL